MCLTDTDSVCVFDTTYFFPVCVRLRCRGLLLPAEELWVGQDLLQTVVVTDAEGEDGLGGLAGKVPGDASRERQHDLPGDLHHTPGTRHRVMETLLITHCI